MATGRSSISSQLSHGRCGGDEGRLTHSPSGPRTLRERVLCSSTRHADHDTEDGGQSSHSEGRAAVRQGEECYAGEEADPDEEPGLMTVTWRADVTKVTETCDRFNVLAHFQCIPGLSAHTDLLSCRSRKMVCCNSVPCPACSLASVIFRLHI